MTTRLFIARADNTPIPVEVEHADRVLLSPVIQRAPVHRRRDGLDRALVFFLVSSVLAAVAIYFAACGGSYPTPADCDGCYKRCAADDRGAEARNECDKGCTSGGCNPTVTQ